MSLYFIHPLLKAVCDANPSLLNLDFFSVYIGERQKKEQRKWKKNKMRQSFNSHGQRRGNEQEYKPERENVSLPDSLRSNLGDGGWMREAGGLWEE